MDQMKRFAVYYAPRPGAFAERAAALLGWQVETGEAVPQPDLPGLPRPLADLTRAPRKYGFHGTLRAPFRLAPQVRPADVLASVTRLAGRLAPVRCDGLRMVSLEGCLALVPQTDSPALQHLAAEVVRDTNAFRAPLTEAEITRRRPDLLTERQRAMLSRWGYPYVLDDFQFHLTLSDPLPPAQGPAVLAAFAAYLQPVLPAPFWIEDLCLFGEDAAGAFHLLHRVPLGG